MATVLTAPLEPSVTSSHPRVRLFGVEIDAVRMSEAVAQLLAWIGQDGGACRYVVTPNVDHAVLLQERPELRQAYAAASLVLADGAPVVLASRLLSRPLPERVAGSDLVPKLFDAANARGPLKVYLLGGMPGVAERAAANIAAKWPHVEVVGTASPPFGFERDAQRSSQLLEEISLVRPDILLVGLGAPKQELWVYEHREMIAARVALCIGATIDFLAGERKRAPIWMRHAGLEWLYRLLSEPRRLWRRYARDAWLFPQLVWRERRMKGNRLQASGIRN
jgi:N-acetylglucosaminyldiphosphoundecaprenol N-acetyl-beta-D-mannosaminyltransferase